MKKTLTDGAVDSIIAFLLCSGTVAVATEPVEESMSKSKVVGIDHGSAMVEGPSSRYEPYVAVAKSDGEVDFVKLPEERSKATADKAAADAVSGVALGYVATGTMHPML